MKRLVIALALLLVTPLLAQKGPGDELGFNPGKLYDFSEVDSVNLYNGNLSITIPIGQRYQVSSTLGYQLSLVYNGKMWDIETYQAPGCAGVAEGVCADSIPNRRSNAGVGWRLSLGRLLPPIDATLGHDESSDERDAFVYEGPAGDEHAFTCIIPEGSSQCPGTAQLASDGSGLRMVTLESDTHGAKRIQIEFPSGERHEFTGHRVTSGFFVEEYYARYRLTQMSDRFGNWVKLAYVEDPLDAYQRRVFKVTITDSINRTHEIFYGYDEALYGDALEESVDYGALITRVELEGVGGARTRHLFEYTPLRTQVLRNADTPFIELPMLTSVTQPDDAKFEFSYYQTPQTEDPPEPGRQGALRKISYPTGGTTEYHYAIYWFPSKATCATNHGLGLDDVGISSRTIDDGKSRRTWNYLEQAGPLAPVDYPLPDRNYCCVPNGYASTATQGPVYWTRNTVLAPIDASNRRTRSDHYFDAYSFSFPYSGENGDAAQVCEILPETHPTPDVPWGPQFPEGGLEVARDPAFRYPGTFGAPPLAVLPGAPGTAIPAESDEPSVDAAGRRLTTVTYSNCSQNGDCTGGKLERSTYTKYERHPLSVTHSAYPWAAASDPAMQLKSTRTVHHEPDASCGGTCETFTDNADDNGAGQYRTVVVSSNFPNKTKLTTSTEYPTWTVTTAQDATKNWIMGLYTERTRTLETNDTVLESARELATFDQATGALLRRRLLKDAAVGTNDVLEVFERDGGNVVRHKLYGADKQALYPTDHLEGTTLGTPWYQTDISYVTATGLRTGGIATRTSVIDRDTGAAFPFLTLDRTIDPSTGLVTLDRDTAGIATSYSYDPVTSRLQTVTRPGGTTSTYQYTKANKVTGANAFVAETVTGAGPIGTNTYEFDGIGRVKRTSTILPNGKVATVQNDYDALGRKGCVTQPLERASHPFTDLDCKNSSHTEWTYDSFDRPLEIKAPDGAISTIAYKGARIIERSNIVATGIGTTSTATVTETYDDRGQLASIEEASGDTSDTVTAGRKITTSYDYNLAGNLTRVSMMDDKATASLLDDVKQERTFTYDGRGFLTREQHPELGTGEQDGTTYAGFDPKGHATTTTTGGSALTFVYDGAERLRSVTGPTGPVKTFTFGTTGAAKGKLQSAKRRNELSSGTIDVTETYQYDASTGLPNGRTTQVDKITMNGGTETTATIQRFDYSLTYDQFQKPAIITMPTCTFVGCVTTNAPPSVTNMRTAGALTEVVGYGKLSYHPTGIVATVQHQTPQLPTDTYAVKDGLARPSRITFGGCTNTKPIFLPGNVLVNPEPASCGLRITWPAATLCGGAGNIKYTVRRNGLNLPGASCLTTTSYTDTTAQKQVAYTYTIVAEGPNAPSGAANGCNHGETTEIAAAPKTLYSCDGDTSIELFPLQTASVGSSRTFNARLTGSGSDLVGMPLEFTILGVKQTVTTGAEGRASVNAFIDVTPGTYPAGVKVRFPGSESYLAKEVTAELTVVCDSSSYTVSPVAFNTLPEGGTYTVAVKTSPRCSWAPIPDSGSFASVCGASGCPAPAGTVQGPGAFKISVPSVGVEQTPRTTYVQVGLRQIKVEQGNACTYTVTPGISYVPQDPAGARGDLYIAAPQNCQWTLSKESIGWLYLYDPDTDAEVSSMTKTGPRTIEYRLGKNNSGKPRSAKILINNASVATLNQSGPTGTVCPGPNDPIDIGMSGDIKNGQYISLRAKTGGTNLVYQWFVNNLPKTPCQGAACAALTIIPGSPDYPSVHPTQTTTFSVKVTNECSGSGSQSVSGTPVAIKRPTADTGTVPRWGSTISNDSGATLPMDKISGAPGANVTLKTTAISVTGAPLLYQWYMGLPGDRSHEESSRPDQEIIVSPDETTMYWVEVGYKKLVNGTYVDEFDPAYGTQTSRSVLVTVTRPPRRRTASHDFSGDGKSDLVFHNKTTRANEMWTMNGTTFVSSRVLPSNAVAASMIQSIGDLNADSMPDLIWRNPSTGVNEVWEMDEYQLTDKVALEGRAGANWVIGATADLDGDTYDDLVWHNNGTGENEIWFMGGNFHSGTWALPPSTSAWGLHGAGDFNGDGKPDLFFHDKTTGDNSVWLMNDAALASVTSNASGSKFTSRKLRVTTQALPPQTDLNVLPAVVADFNGDGKPDVIWRDKVTGANTAWIMNGTTVAETRTLQAKVGTDWQIGGGGSTTTDGISEPVTGTATTVTGSATSAPSGGHTTVTATLRAGSTPLPNRTVIVTLNGAEATRLATDANGTITAVVSVGALAAGTYPAAIRARYEGAAGYLPSATDLSLTITPSAAIVTWNTPSAITYPTPLSATQLNASANVPGMFTYAPVSGTVLDAGLQQLSMTFTPTDSGRAPVTANVVLTVQKATPTVTWAAPAAITYGTPLSALQLDASSSTPGTLTYSPAAGAIPDVGSQTLSVTLTPTSQNYNSVTSTTTLQVDKGAQVVRWTPGPLAYGMPLGSTQLNATVITSGSAPAGALTYLPASGTVLPEGTHALTVMAASTASYEAASLTVDVTVSRSDVTLTWNTPAAVPYGTFLGSAQLNASANVPGTFTYNPPADTLLDAGYHRLTATFTPTSNQYLPASTSVILEVTKLPTSIAWTTPAPITYGTALTSAQLNATADRPGSFIYTPSLGDKLPAGTHTLTAVFAPSDATNVEAGTRTVTLALQQAAQAITWSTPANITYGTPLAASQLNATVTVPGPSPHGTLTYSHALGTVLPVGTHDLTATAAATNDYTSATTTVTVTVTQATPTIQWSAPSPITYGTALGTAQLNATASVAGALTYTPEPGTILDAGVQTLNVAFLPSDTTNYTSATGNTTLTVEQAPSTIAWDAPANITYGMPLTASQLNASANVPGTFTYDPPEGTLLNAGTHTLNATFTPTSANYQSATATTTLVVDKQTPIITWTTPAPISYGTPLGTAQLTASTTGGTITYQPASGSVLGAGTHELTASVAASTNHHAATSSVTLTVLPANLTITATDGTKQYSDAMPDFTATATGFVNGDDLGTLTGTLTFSTSATPQSQPDSYPITMSGVSSANYAITFVPGTLQVLPEDARVTITTPPLATAGTLLLSATIQDVSATAAANGDTTSGDVRYATLTFIDRTTGTSLCNATIGLATADVHTGTGTCTATRSTGTLTLGAVVSGWYSRDNPSDNQQITILGPTQDTLTGAGSAAPSSSAGVYAPDTSATRDLDADIQYEYVNQTLSGHLVLAYNRTGDGTTRRYEITMLNGASMAIERTIDGGRAFLMGSARLRDITIPSAPVTIAASAPLLVTTTDGAITPGVNDWLGFTLHNASGGILAATGWSAVDANEQKIIDGYIAVFYQE